MCDVSCAGAHRAMPLRSSAIRRGVESGGLPRARRAVFFAPGFSRSLNVTGPHPCPHRIHINHIVALRAWMPLRRLECALNLTSQLCAPFPHPRSLPFIAQATRLKNAKDAAKQVEEDLSREERAPSALGVPTPLPEDFIPSPEKAADDDLLAVAAVIPSPTILAFSADMSLVQVHDSKYLT